MKKNRFIFCIAFFLWILGFSIFAQEQGEIATARQASNAGASLSASAVEASQNIMLARSSVNYRVTPGDVYTLAYAVGSTSVSYTITVDTSYRIRVSNLGIINGAGKTFMQLKSEVEAVVVNNYPLSGVQLVLTQPAIFRVYVKGEVYMAEEVSAWGLSRLSVLVGYNLTAYASLRDISIKSANGQTRVYDLFKAQRLGDLSQDPYLRPGDEITFNRIKRLVTITGEVGRPGRYQLLDGENINELIEFYGGGFTPIADSTRLEMVRMINGTDIAGDKIFLTENDLANNYVLEHYDVVFVPGITPLQPVMFLEGAVVEIVESSDYDKNLSTSTTSELVSSNRLVVQFNKGETYASLVRRNVKWFTAVSDTRNAYIIRDDKHIPINLNPMLYDAAYRGEVLVMENDVLIVPFRQYFVTVAGAVVSPGRYPYIPDRDWEYYIALAGGFIMERNTRQAIAITDLSGRSLKKTDAITPETTITASTNHALYYFNQFAPVLTTLLSIISTTISIVMISTR
jgi:protein involved in polysaccharide export with SLBB domain